MNQLYCSLDLELTGFDPLKDEILEIGFCFFVPTVNGLKITEQWSQVFSPSVEVHPKILGLTGITQSELETAPKLSEYHEFLQSKLRDVIIVGHNTVLDAKFLEAFGVRLSGETVDTLDLVQFLLPTHHSYNLENLMHYFQVNHEEAHRALADSQATVALLEKLLRHYYQFPESLRTQIVDIARKQQFTWLPLFTNHFEFPYQLNNKQSAVSAQAQAPVSYELAQNQINYVAPDIGEVDLAQLLRQASADNYLLVIPDKQKVLSLWQEKLVKGLFSSEDSFSQENFTRLLSTDLTQEQAKFCLKILVWLETNWQRETIADLNLTFFGSQFRSLITGASLIAAAPDKVLCCDYQTFAELAEKKLYQGRTPVIWKLHDFERWLNSGNRSRLAWSQSLYLLRSIYNPETNYGRLDLKSEVATAIAGADLYFGLVNLLLQRHFSGHKYVTYEQLADNSYVLSKIKSAAENFQQKLAAFSQEEFPAIHQFTQSLSAFFEPNPNYVKWIETAEFNCVFYNQPLHVNQPASQLLENFAPPVWLEDLRNPLVVTYLKERLGLSVETAKADTIYLSQEKPAVKGLVWAESSSHSLLSLIEQIQGPGLVVLPTLAAVKEFYTDSYEVLKGKFRLFAQGYSGGSNKILRNFALRPDSILIATPDFILRNARHALPVKTVLLGSVPQTDREHPYARALFQYWQQQFPEFWIMQNSYQFSRLLNLVYSSQLEQVHLFESVLQESFGPGSSTILQSVPWLSVDKASN